MSMPSSSELVATTAGRRPALRSSSIRSRCSRLTEPWCARAISSPAISFSFAHSRSASRREFANTIVLRCSRISSTQPPVDVPARCWPFLRPVAAAVPVGRPRRARPCPRPARRPKVERLLGRRRHDRRPGRSRRGTARPPRAGGRRRQPDALGRPAEQLVDPLERQRQVRAALRPGDRVHLVDDHRLDAAQRLARLRGEDQEQGLGRGDEDVGRVLREPPPVLRRRVAGPDGDVDRRGTHARPARPTRAHPGERRTEVPLDVDGQRLQRRDVQHPQARRGIGGRARPPAGRAPTGTPPASSPTRSARPRACLAPTRSRPTRQPAPRWAASKASRNHVAARDEKRRGGSASRLDLSPSSGHGGRPMDTRQAALAARTYYGVETQNHLRPATQGGTS